MDQARQLGTDCSVYTDSTLRLLFHFPASSPTLHSLLQVLAATSPSIDPSRLDSLISTLPASLLNEFFDRAKSFYSSQTPNEDDANVIAATVGEQLSWRIKFYASLIDTAGEFWAERLLKMSSEESETLFSTLRNSHSSVQNLVLHLFPRIDPFSIEDDIDKSWLSTKLPPIIISMVQELDSFAPREADDNLDDEQREQRAIIWYIHKNSIELLTNICLYTKHLTTSTAGVVVIMRDELYSALTDFHHDDQIHALTLISEQRPSINILLNMIEALSSGIHLM